MNVHRLAPLLGDNLQTASGRLVGGLLLLTLVGGTLAWLFAGL